MNEIPPIPSRHLSPSANDLTRRNFLMRVGAVGALAVTPGLLAACGGDSSSSTDQTEAAVSGTLSYFGWESEDFAEQAKAFTKRNGITVQTQSMDTITDPIGKLLGGGGADIDILGVTQAAVPAYTEAGILQPIDKSKVPNLANVFPPLLDADGVSVDGELYLIPTYWAPFGLSRNTETVPQPFKSFRDVLDPALKGRVGGFADPYQYYYGICAMLSLAPGKLEKGSMPEAKELLEQVLAQSKNLAPSFGDTITQLVSGEIDVAFPGFINYDAYVAEANGPEVVTDFELKEGSFGFVDGIAIPVDADNVETAYAYANELLDPKVNAAIGDFTASGVTIEDAVELQDPSISGRLPYATLNQFLPTVKWEYNPPAESDTYVTSPEWIEMFTSVTA